MRLHPLHVPAIALVGTACALVYGCAPAAGDGWPDRPGPKVVASFAPIECFALNVAGDDAVVRQLMTSQGPHEFVPGPADARMLSKADLFFINGLTLDDAKCNPMARMSGNRKLKLVNLGAKLPDDLLEIGGGDCCKTEPAHGHEGHAHEHGTHDPHIWMGLPQTEKMVEGIRDELKGVDPAHAADYDRRAAEYTGKLRALKAEGDALLKDKKERKFVTFHESLGYFADTYNLTIAGVIEDVPGAEPTPKQRDELVKACVKDKVRVIAVEPQYSKAAAQQIVRELEKHGVKDPQIVRIDPMETATADEITPGWYEDRMRENLKALAAALR